LNVWRIRPRSGSHQAGSGLHVEVCAPELRDAALEVLYRRVPVSLRERLIVEVLSEVQRGEIDLSGLWIVRRKDGQVTGALLTQALAGKVAAVWAPEVRPSWRRAKLAALLVQTALLQLQARGIRLAQAVLDESAGPQAARDLNQGGMPRVTELLYLERETSTPMRKMPGLLQNRTSHHSDSNLTFDWRPFEPAVEAEFRSVLQATYQGSLDMPELEGARSLDDIMQGHRSAGRFVAERWRLGRLPGEPEAAAVLLLAEIPGRNVWEIIYLGLTPQARGRGLGREALLHALELARPHVPWLELAVDLRNRPATRLYQSSGFAIRDRRAVHLAILGEPLSDSISK
jgi:ribosomal protein S18 acetylase RimI-like enzyme